MRTRPQDGQRRTIGGFNHRKRIQETATAAEELRLELFPIAEGTSVRQRTTILVVVQDWRYGPRKREPSTAPDDSRQRSDSNITGRNARHLFGLFINRGVVIAGNITKIDFTAKCCIRAALIFAHFIRLRCHKQRWPSRFIKCAFRKAAR